MGHNEETTSIKGQENQATLSLTTFDKDKLVAMQQVLEGMTQHRSFQQCLSQGQNKHTKGTSEETSGRSLEEDEVQ